MVKAPGFSLQKSSDPLIIGIPVREKGTSRVYEITCETEQQATVWAQCIFRHIQLNDDNDD